MTWRSPLASWLVAGPRLLYCQHWCFVVMAADFPSLGRRTHVAIFVEPCQPESPWDVKSSSRLRSILHRKKGSRKANIQGESPIFCALCTTFHLASLPSFLLWDMAEQQHCLRQSLQNNYRNKLHVRTRDSLVRTDLLRFLESGSKSARDPSRV